MSEPRRIRGGTMRPENCSKVWSKTFCEWSRLITLWSSVTPLRAGLRVCCETPLDAPRVLKAASQESKLPLPQGAAACAGPAAKASAAPNIAVTRRRYFVATNAFPIQRCCHRAMQHVGLNRGQNMADAQSGAAGRTRRLGSSDIADARVVHHPLRVIAAAPWK